MELNSGASESRASDATHLTYSENMVDRSLKQRQHQSSLDEFQPTPLLSSSAAVSGTMLYELLQYGPCVGTNPFKADGLALGRLSFTACGCSSAVAY